MIEKYGVDSSELEVNNQTKEAIEKIASEQGVEIPSFNNQKEAEEFLFNLLDK
ncbi:MAG: hypothetical protein ACLR0A_18945 [Faecalibacillus intestinalis]